MHACSLSILGKIHSIYCKQNKGRYYYNLFDVCILRPALLDTHIRPHKILDYLAKTIFSTLYKIWLLVHFNKYLNEIYEVMGV